MTGRRLLAAFLGGLLMCAATGCGAEAREPAPRNASLKPVATPLRWGVNFEVTQILKPKLGEILEHFDVDFVVIHAGPAGKNLAFNERVTQSMDAFCVKNDVDWIRNLESANWQGSAVDENGKDWYNHADGRHYFLFPERMLEAHGKCERLLGFLYDEAEHMQNCRNRMAKIDKPFIYDPRDDELEDASRKFVKAARDLAKLHQKHGIRLYTEHVFPVLFHAFAEAGWQPATKILKEHWNGATLACLMGAAIQYDVEFWASPDIWWLQDYPGHTPERYGSALRLAYHLGVDVIYTENLAWRPPSYSLVKLEGDDWKEMPLGKVAREFKNEYVPANPRMYTFRDVQPRTIIIRQEDTCWGQYKSFLPDAMYGNKAWKCGDVNKAWLRLWNLLSAGTIPPTSLTWNSDHYRDLPYQTFHPLDGVVVFDHKVAADHLAHAEVIFLTGIGVSRGTLRAVSARVREGVTCVGLPHLLPKKVRAKTGNEGVLEDGEGKWVATTDFLAAHVKPHVAHVIPDKNVLRYRFGDTVITARPRDGDLDRIEVEVTAKP